LNWHVYQVIIYVDDNRKCPYRFRLCFKPAANFVADLDTIQSLFPIAHSRYFTIISGYPILEFVLLDLAIEDAGTPCLLQGRHCPKECGP
jgi:hypothetical protein